MHFELAPLVWIALWIVNTYSEFQVNIFINNRDIQNITVSARRRRQSRRRQGYSNTFSPKRAELTIWRKKTKNVLKKGLVNTLSDL